MKKKTVIAIVSTAVTMMFFASCGNRQSSDELPVDSATQMKIAGLKNATLVKQLDDCAIYLAEDESWSERNLIIRYTPEKHKCDTLSEEGFWIRVKDYKVVEDGLLFIANGKINLLRFSTGEIEDVIETGIGDVIFADTYLSFYRFFWVHWDDDMLHNESDSMYFRLDYSDLSERNLSKTIASKNEEFKRYVNQAKINWEKKYY